MMNKKRMAFTLIEVMVVMAVIAVLSVLIIGAITLTRRVALETRHRANAKVVQSILEMYASRNGGRYPYDCPRNHSRCSADPATRTVCACGFEDTEYSFGTGGLFGTGGGTLNPAPECQRSEGGLDLIMSLPGFAPNIEFDSSGGGVVEYRNRGSGYVIHIGNWQCLNELEHWDVN